MSLVLEKQEPILVLTVNLDLHLDRAGVYLLALVELLELSRFLQVFCRQCADIHEVLRLCSTEFFSCRKVFFVGLFKQLVLKFHAVDSRQEGRVTAVIRPIRIYHLDFGYRGVALFAREIFTAEFDVVDIHRKPELLYKLLKLGVAHLNKSVNRRNACGNLALHRQGLGLIKACFSRFNRVDDVFFDRLNVSVRQTAAEDVNLRRANGRTLAAGHDLYALRRAVGSLVELTGEILDRKNPAAARVKLTRCNIELRLGKHRCDRLVKYLFRDVFGIVAVEYADILDILHAEQIF